jgi:hypothetical protein
MAAVDAATDPKEKLALLTKNMQREDLTRDDVLAGLLGDLSNQRARKLLEDQARQQADQQRQQAYDRGDLYSLGQMEAANLQAQRQQIQAQNELDNNPYMTAIRGFQSGLPENVQREVQGRNYDSFGAYLAAVHESALRHGLEQEVGKRANGLSKAQLSQTVGSEQSPELDGGPAMRTREITGAQVAAMSNEEFDQHFDEKGRPRAGVVYTMSERDIDVRRESRR